jgi:hypothetical protein
VLFRDFEKQMEIQNRKIGALLVPLCAAVAYLYANLFVWPNIPILLSGDQIYFWTDAQRMMFGELPYRDFFKFTPSGTDLIYFALFKWLGPRLWVTNMVVLALGIALCCACLSIARQIMGRGAALLSALLFLTLIYGRLLNATHHWFSILLILCAARISMESSRPLGVVAIGIILGVAAFFTQTHAAVTFLAFVALLALQARRWQQPVRLLLERIVLLLVVLAATWVVCQLPLILRIGFQQLWYYQFTFVHQYMVHRPEGAFLGWPEVPSLRRVPEVAQYFIVYAVIVVTYPLSLWQCWLRRYDDDQRVWVNVAFFSLLGTFLVVEVAFSLNWLRVYAVSVPAFVLGVFWLERMERPGRNIIRIVWAAAILLALLQTSSKFRRQYVVTDLPAGRAAISAVTNEKFMWIVQRTRPGEFFFEALQPTTYFPLGLRSPVFAEGMTELPQTRPEFVERAIRELDSKPARYVLWSHYLDDPGTNHKAVDRLSPFRAYLNDHYRLVHVFSDQDEMWERN